MAKQLVNPVERHWEKAVLLGSAGVLVYFAAMFGVVSPNQVEVAGQNVSPKNIDAKVMETARQTQDRIRDQRVPVDPVEPRFDEFKRALDPFEAAGVATNLKIGTLMLPPVPVVDPPDEGFGGADLPAVVDFAPGQSPKVVHGRSTFSIESLQGLRQVVSNWVMVASVFDVKAQMAELRKKYGALRTDVVFGPPQLQRRTQRADGTWPEQWIDVTPFKATREPPKLSEVPAVQLVDDGETIEAGLSSVNAVDQYFSYLTDPGPLPDGGTQLRLIRSLLPTIANGTPFRLPVFTSRRDILMQDDFYLFPNEPPATEPEDRYPDAQATTRGPVEKLTKDQEFARKFQKALELLASAKKNNNENDALRAWNVAEEVERDPAAKAADKNRALQIKTESDRLVQNIRRFRLRQGGQAIQDDDREFVREPLPYQTVWLIDGETDSVKSGRNYQYRIRASIFNALAAQPQKLRNPVDATKVLIYGPWSEPVDVSIPRDSAFYVTGIDERNEAVSLELYRWFEGVWVKSPRRIKLTLQDEMSETQVTKVPDINDPTVAAPADVEFSQNARILDIEFARPLREREKAGRAGVRFGDVRQSAVIVYVDDEGRLHEKYVETDKQDPGRKILTEKLYQPPRGTN